MMVKVKICGITTVSDAIMAARAGADALGFNFVKGSPRYITPEKARPIVMSLPPFVSAVGVFMDSPVELVQSIAKACELDYVQLHGHETPRKVSRMKGLRILKAIRVAGEEDVKNLGKYQVDGFVLDTFVEGQPGGTGQTFNWHLARGASGTGNTVFVAGGLTPDNVAAAVETARPYGVDTASGVEDSPGEKSRDLVTEFIRAAKSVTL